MNRFFVIVVCGMLLLISVTSAASMDSTAAFQSFRALKGKWSIQSNGKTLTIVMTYDDGSSNSIVTEQFGKELSVFYRDGQDLLITHFCNNGIQPRLKLRGSSAPKLFEFETFDMTNAKNADQAHVQRIIYEMVDDKHLSVEIVWKENSSEKSEKYKLTRFD